MICARCDQPLRPDEAEARDVPSASAAGATVHIHREPCEPPAGTRPRTYQAR